MKNFCVLMLLALVVFGASCNKNIGYQDYTNTVTPFAGNTYQYLQSKPGVFDSLLYVIDRLGLTDTLKNNKITLFAVTNRSFQLALNQLNSTRTASGFAPITLKTYDYQELDSLMDRYIIRGKVSSDSMSLKNGLSMRSVRIGYPMNGKKNAGDAAGLIGGGSSFITFSSTNRTTNTQFWTSATANSIDITTANGYVNVLDPSHIFGFGGFSVPKALPFKGITPQFPVNIGDSVVIQVEDYALGGEGVAYHSVNGATNATGPYRPNDNIPLAAFAPRYAGGIYFSGPNNSSVIGLYGPPPTEWLVYPVNVNADGNYEVVVRYALPAYKATGVPLTGIYHIEFDQFNYTGNVTLKSTTTKVNVNDEWRFFHNKTVFLKKGIHYMKFYIELDFFSVDSFAIIRR